jgi:hypothetical protein
MGISVRAEGRRFQDCAQLWGRVYPRFSRDFFKACEHIQRIGAQQPNYFRVLLQLGTTLWKPNRVISKVTLSSPCVRACFHPLSPLSVVSAM